MLIINVSYIFTLYATCGNDFKVHLYRMTKFLIFISLVPTLSFGQAINTTTKNGRGNIYNDAIKHFISFTSKSDKSIYDTLFILKDDLLTDSLQTTIQKTKIVLFDSSFIADRLFGDNSFVTHRIFPLSFDNGHFYVNIVPFVIHKGNGEVTLLNTGTFVVSYTFDSKTKTFKFYRSTWNGF